MRIDPFLCVIMNDRPLLRGDFDHTGEAARFAPSAGSVTVRFIGVEPEVGVRRTTRQRNDNAAH